MSIDLTKLPDSPMPSYTFTLFSRDLFEKSKFNDYDSLLESKLARCQARADHLASILANGNVIGANGTLTRPHGARENIRARNRVPKTTSTNYINSEYVASFTVGSEHIKNYLLIDTGSDLVWWQCQPCKCYKQNNPQYSIALQKEQVVSPPGFINVLRKVLVSTI
ncbi:putative aspartic proteinase nepenthesin-1-like [Capsicum annuum]|nr:putative aspartic proteinase nepenthesin-1-like [Capsicum annuum]